MITVIGTLQTALGFRLCGLEDVHEVPTNVTKEELLELIKKSDKKLVFMQDILCEKVKYSGKKIIISVPTTDKECGPDINKIVQDALGVSFEK